MPYVSHPGPNGELDPNLHPAERDRRATEVALSNSDPVASAAQRDRDAFVQQWMRENDWMITKGGANNLRSGEHSEQLQTELDGRSRYNAAARAEQQAAHPGGFHADGSRKLHKNEPADPADREWNPTNPRVLYRNDPRVRAHVEQWRRRMGDAA